MQRKIAIVGPESTGKTMLTGLLATHYKAGMVKEVAREYIDALSRNYVLDDLVAIARLQLEEEDKASREQTIVFCDTNLAVVKIWAEFVFGTCPTFIDRNFKERRYDLHLLTHIDLPWEPDPQREHPQHRAELFARYKNLLDHNQLPYHIITGMGDQRVSNAISLLDNFL